jgi:phenylalanyl-tRNA synthetase beta chain
LEYGQPTHAFDGDKVEGKVSVRLARPGEKIKTLDGKERELVDTDILIADDKKAIGIAGVMGGENTEISNNTKTILLEAAIFDPGTLRKTSQRLNLPSEASRRFQHGLSNTRLFQALDAAIRMYENMGGKLVGISLIYQKPEQINGLDPLRSTELSLNKVKSHIGIDISKEEIETSLKKLNFRFGAEKQIDSDVIWNVISPFWRLDIEIQEDLIEEIARLYGYEKIPAIELKGEFPEKVDQKLFDTIYNTKKSFADNGLIEVQSYSFLSTKSQQAMGYTKESIDLELIKLANPISSETEYLKNFLWPNLLEIVDKNIKTGYKDIGIFEVGKVYTTDSNKNTKESYHIAAALMNSTDNPMAELVSIIRKVLTHVIPMKMGIQSESQRSGSPMNSGMTDIDSGLARMTEESGMTIELKEEPMMEELKSLFHPTRYLNVYINGEMAGAITEVHPRVIDKFGIANRVCILEISLEKLL